MGKNIRSAVVYGVKGAKGRRELSGGDDNALYLDGGFSSRVCMLFVQTQHTKA